LDLSGFKFNKRLKVCFAVITAVAALVFAGVTLAAVMSGGNYEVEKDVVDSGGSKVSGGNYELIQSIGQPHPVGTSSGGNYGLQHGFFHKGAIPPGASALSNITTSNFF